MAPCEASPDPVPAPPASNGDLVRAVSRPSACREKPATVFAPAGVSFTYTNPDWYDCAADATAGAAMAPTRATRPATMARDRSRERWCMGSPYCWGLSDPTSVGLVAARSTLDESPTRSTGFTAPAQRHQIVRTSARAWAELGQI